MTQYRHILLEVTVLLAPWKYHYSIVVACSDMLSFTLSKSCWIWNCCPYQQPADQILAHPKYCNNLGSSIILMPIFWLRHIIYYSIGSNYWCGTKRYHYLCFGLLPEALISQCVLFANAQCGNIPDKAQCGNIPDNPQWYPNHWLLKMHQTGHCHYSSSDQLRFSVWYCLCWYNPQSAAPLKKGNLIKVQGKRMLPEVLPCPAWYYCFGIVYYGWNHFGITCLSKPYNTTRVVMRQWIK